MTKCEYPKKESRIWGGERDEKKGKSGKEEEERKYGGKKGKRKKSVPRSSLGIFWSFFFSDYCQAGTVIPPVLVTVGSPFSLGQGGKKGETGTKSAGNFPPTIQTEVTGLTNFGLPADLHFQVVLPPSESFRCGVKLIHCMEERNGYF